VTHNYLNESELKSMQINIRKAEAKDVYDVFDLSNLHNTRKYSINTDKILWRDHLVWYDEVLKNDSIVLYIITDDKNLFLGQVRYNIQFKYAEISISLIDEMKGKGLGIDILLKSQEMIKKDKNINSIRAIIKKENKPSIRLFERAGYKFVKADDGFSEYNIEL
jgi:RimJ/RimL family protein N-acetyltransferase